MRQVLQRLDSGATVVSEVPAPVCGPREVLIANQASLLSAGTERQLVELSRRSLLGKALQRPDQARRMLEKVRDEGLLEAVRQARTRLSEPMALGYSSAGVVLAVGRQVRRFRPGDHVASNGPHAEIVAVPENLVAAIPSGVSFREACYAVVASIAVHGVRLARVGVGDRVAVVGLGLVGQIAAMVLDASGCVVLGCDTDPARRRRARDSGVDVAAPEELSALVLEKTDGQGADAVLVTAAADDSGPVDLAVGLARRKARVVIVGAVGLNLQRPPLYAKEIELVVSSSYGPGRYDPHYEDGTRDYPYAYVRWTAQRNIGAALELMHRKKLAVERLTTHTFEIDRAGEAYALVTERRQPFLGVVLTYPQSPTAASARIRDLAPAGSVAAKGDLGIGVVGAGGFASSVLLPALAGMRGVRKRVVCSARGVSAVARGEPLGFERATSSFDEVLADEAVQAVFLATRHELHVEQALLALRSGKHVFVEKPLAIREEDLKTFEAALLELAAQTPLWTVGFNRRFSASARLVREFFADVPPSSLTYRFNAGALPPEHWTHDPESGGGRLVGEACHALDFAGWLLGGGIVRVHAERAGGTKAELEDQAVISLRTANGGVASIAYFSDGDKSVPKERIEVFGAGRTAVIDDFRSVTLSAHGRTKTHRLGPRDKGHAAELEAFLAAVRQRKAPPIPYSELLNVSWASLAVILSLREGGPIPVPVS